MWRASKTAFRLQFTTRVKASGLRAIGVHQKDNGSLASLILTDWKFKLIETDERKKLHEIMIVSPVLSGEEGLIYVTFLMDALKKHTVSRETDRLKITVPAEGDDVKDRIKAIVTAYEGAYRGLNGLLIHQLVDKAPVRFYKDTGIFTWVLEVDTGYTITAIHMALLAVVMAHNTKTVPERKTSLFMSAEDVIDRWMKARYTWVVDDPDMPMPTDETKDQYMDLGNVLIKRADDAELAHGPLS